MLASGLPAASHRTAKRSGTEKRATKGGERKARQEGAEKRERGRSRRPQTARQSETFRVSIDSRGGAGGGAREREPGDMTCPPRSPGGPSRAHHARTYTRAREADGFLPAAADGFSRGGEGLDHLLADSHVARAPHNTYSGFDGVRALANGVGRLLAHFDGDRNVHFRHGDRQRLAGCAGGL